MYYNKHAREPYTARRSFHKAGLPRRVCVPLGAVQTRLRMIPGVPRFYGVSCARCLARFRSGAGSQASPLEGIGKHAATAWGVISSPFPAVPSYTSSSKLYEGCYHARSMGPD